MKGSVYVSSLSQNRDQEVVLGTPYALLVELSLITDGYSEHYIGSLFLAVFFLFANFTGTVFTCLNCLNNPIFERVDYFFYLNLFRGFCQSCYRIVAIPDCSMSRMHRLQRNHCWWDHR